MSSTECSDNLCLSCQKFTEQIKYFLTVHYFVVIMSILSHCAYINVFSSHHDGIFKIKTNDCVIEREKERETDRKRERERETERQRDREEMKSRNNEKVSVTS